MVNITEKYICFLKEKNKKSFSTSKDFYILINSKNSPEKTKEKIEKELLEKYLKIKEILLRCGNIVKEIKTKEETEEIIKSFL